MAQKRLSSKNFIRRVKRRHGDRFTLNKTIYTTKREKIVVTCKTHGDFEVYPQVLLKSPVGCLRCGHRLTLDKFLKRSRNKHGVKYDYNKVELISVNDKVTVVCPKHGDFNTVPYLHYARGVGCPECALEKNRTSIDDFIKRAIEIHGNKYDYSEVEYVTGNQPVTINCPQHGRFQQKPRVHIQGSGCGDCFVVRNKSNTEEFVKQANKVHGDRYSYSSVRYKTSKVKVMIICAKHGPFWTTPNSHISSAGGCFRCKESKGETKIRVFLDKHGINHIQEYKIKPHRYRYDFFLPSYNILIEYQGHQHFKPVERFGGEEYFKLTVKRDQLKQKLADKNNYPLLKLGYWLSKQEGLEIALELVLRAAGHRFDESLTITNTWSA